MKCFMCYAQNDDSPRLLWQAGLAQALFQSQSVLFSSEELLNVTCKYTTKAVL